MVKRCERVLAGQGVSEQKTASYTHCTQRQCIDFAQIQCTVLKALYLKVPKSLTHPAGWSFCTLMQCTTVLLVFYSWSDDQSRNIPTQTAGRDRRPDEATLRLVLLCSALLHFTLTRICSVLDLTLIHFLHCILGCQLEGSK